MKGNIRSAFRGLVRILQGALWVAVLQCLAAATASAQGSAEPIKLGLITSLTGPASVSGFNGSAAVKLAVKEINASGGVLGRQLRVVEADDRSDPTAAVSEVRRLVQSEKVDFIIGPAISQHALAISPLLTESRIGSVSVVGSPALTPQAAPYHFGAYTGDIQVVAISDYIAAQGAKSVAILNESGSLNRLQLEGFKREFPKRGIQIKGAQEYAQGDSDVTPQLLSLRRENADMFLLLPNSGIEAGNALKGMREIGWNPKVVGNAAVTSQPNVVLKITGPEGYNNVVGIQIKALTYCSNDAVGSSDYAKLRETVRRTDPDNFPKYSMPLFAMIYDSVYAFKAGVEGARKLDGPSFASWMEQNGNKLRLVTGPLSPSASYHFLFGPSALTLVEHPESTRSDGLNKRSGC